MKVLFVISELDYADHIAIAYLSAVAGAEGYSRAFCSLETADLVDAVRSTRPDVVAYSANVASFTAIVEAHRRARAAHHFVSILGGPQATFSPATLAESGVDAYCVGEGEGAFGDFLRRAAAGQGFSDVPNLITAAGANPVRPLIKDLDSLPEADRDLTIANSFLRDVQKKTFYATRGCPEQCSYCCNDYYHKLYRGEPTVRRFSVERVIAEAERVKARYRMEFVKFGDDMFCIRADPWLEEFAEKYPRRVGVPFNCYLRLDLVTEDMLKLLKAAGSFSVHLSLDSTSEHVREKVLRRHMRGSTEDMVKKLRLIRDYGINTWVNFMLAAPESTVQDDLETIAFSRRGNVTYPAYSITVPMAGTDLYDYCLRRGLLDPDTHKSDMTGCYERPTLKCFSRRESEIRYNVFLLGVVAAKLPWPLDRVALLAIRWLPPNGVFRWIRDLVYHHNIERHIFALR